MSVHDPDSPREFWLAFLVTLMWLSSIVVWAAILSAAR